MKYYSEITNRTYNTEKECIEAEQAIVKAREEKKAKEEKLSKERAERAKIVYEKRIAYVKALEDYREEVQKFVKDYGSYHMSYSSKSPLSLFDMLF